jgi:hypothetical protein
MDSGRNGAVVLITNQHRFPGAGITVPDLRFRWLYCSLCHWGSKGIPVKHMRDGEAEHHQPLAQQKHRTH